MASWKYFAAGMTKGAQSPMYGRTLTREDLNSLGYATSGMLRGAAKGIKNVPNTVLHYGVGWPFSFGSALATKARGGSMAEGWSDAMDAFVDNVEKPVNRKIMDWGGNAVKGVADRAVDFWGERAGATPADRELLSQAEGVTEGLSNLVGSWPFLAKLTKYTGKASDAARKVFGPLKRYVPQAVSRISQNTPKWLKWTGKMSPFAYNASAEGYREARNDFRNQQMQDDGL